MFHVNPKTSAVLDIVTHGLAPGERRSVDCAPGTFLALQVSRTGDRTYTTAHVVYEPGHALPDPEVEWWQGPLGKWIPTSIQQITGHQVRAVQMADGSPVMFSAEKLVDLVYRCDQWLGENFLAQQGGLDALRGACGVVAPEGPS